MGDEVGNNSQICVVALPFVEIGALPSVLYFTILAAFPSPFHCAGLLERCMAQLVGVGVTVGGERSAWLSFFLPLFGVIPGLFP